MSSATPFPPSRTSETMSKWPELDSSIPAAKIFPRFSTLPSEIRHQIWEYALPGPRIVYIERVYSSSNNADEILHQEGRHRRSPPPLPTATHFSSLSPDSAVVSLLYACKESFEIVRKHYSQIFKCVGTGTGRKKAVWVDFERDFLYLHFGQNCFSLPYYPAYFLPRDKEISDHLGAAPEIDPEVTRCVKNLVVSATFDFQLFMDNDDGLEAWLVKKVLGVFRSVKVLVLADQAHHLHESGEELEWRRGALSDGAAALVTGDENGFQSELPDIEGERLEQLLVWRDGTDYGRFSQLDRGGFEEKWATYHGREDRKMPTVVRRNVTTSRIKNRLAAICGSEEHFLAAEGMDWNFVLGEHGYKGPLHISKQIEYLEIVEERMTMKRPLSTCTCGLEEPWQWDLRPLLARIEALYVEWEMEALVISEAEEMVWD